MPTQLQDFIEQIKNIIQQGNLPVLLLLIVVFLYAFCKPGGVVIGSLPDIPNYSFFFWLLEGVLIILVFALLISKSLAFFILVAILAITLWFYRESILSYFSNILNPVKGQGKHLILIICTLAAIVITYFLTQGQPLVDPQIAFANEADRFSFGENILVSEEYVSKGDSNCQNHWGMKEKAKNAYAKYIPSDKAKLDQAFKSFNDFILWCQNDPEAHIYRNNTSAMRHHPINIAVSVPIRGVDTGPLDS